MSDTIRYQFAGFTFSPNEYRLETPKGKEVVLATIPCKLLRIFVENYGSVLSIDDLIKEVWSGRIEDVENETVTHQISALRKVLKQHSKKSKLIVNVRKEGYTLATEVKRIEQIDKGSLSVINHPQTSSRPDADIYQELAGIKNELRLQNAKINYLASWINLMWEAIPKPERARLIYEQVRMASLKLIGPEQDLQISNLEMIDDRIQDTFSYYRDIPSDRELVLASDLGRYWDIQGQWSKGCEILQGALSRHPEAASDIQALTLAWLSYLSYCRDDYKTAKQAASKSITISKQIDNDDSLALSFHILGAISETKGAYSQAKSYYLDCVKLAHPVRFGWLIALTLRELGKLAEVQEYYGSAEKLYLQSLTKREELEDTRGIAAIQNYIAGIAIKKQDYTQARSRVDQSLAFNGGSTFGLTCCYFNLGMIEEDSTQYKESFDFYQRCLALRQGIDDRRGQARAIEGMAKVTLKSGNEKEAAGLFGSAYQIRQAISAPLSPAEQRAYGELSRSLRKKYFREFEKGSERLSEMMSLKEV